MEEHKIEHDCAIRKKDEQIAALETENGMLHLRCATLMGQLKKQRDKIIYLSNKVEDALREKNQWKSSVLKLQESIGHLQSEYNNLKATVDTMPEQVQEHCNQVLEMVGTRTAAVTAAHGEVDALHTALVAKEEQLQTISEQLQKEKEQRKFLHNTVMELRGNIRVHCRVRPVMEMDRRRGNFDLSHGAAFAVIDQVVHVPDDESVTVKAQRNFKCFDYEKVYQPDTSQTTVFEEMQPLVTSVLDGYNVCVMAYGQTGSGKTHTMLGKHNKDQYNISTTEPKPDEGIVPRAIRYLFRSMAEKPVGMHTVEISVVEIYNNEIRDLLSHDSAGTAKPTKHDIVMGADGTMCLPSVSSWPADTASNAMKWVREGLRARCTGATLVHEHSSRSHLIVILTVITEPSLERVSPCPGSSPKRRSNASVSSTRDSLSPNVSPTKRGRSQIPRYGALKTRSRSPSPLRTTRPQKSSPFTDSVIRTKLQFVDLAGSECVGVAGTTGSQVKETSHINKSLCALADVLAALSECRNHVPYRNSKLTHLLQDSIGGDAKLMIFLCVSPTRIQLSETLQTLGFGQRARQVHRGQVRKRASSAPSTHSSSAGHAKGEVPPSPKLTRVRSSSMKTLAY